RNAESPRELINVLTSNSRIEAREDHVGPKFAEWHSLYRIGNRKHIQPGVNLLEPSSLNDGFPFPEIARGDILRPKIRRLVDVLINERHASNVRRTRDMNSKVRADIAPCANNYDALLC